VDLFFSYYHNYNKGSLCSFFFVTISIIGGGIYLHFLSHCSDEEEVLTFWGLLALQVAYPCYHNYNKGRFGFVFSCCHKYSKLWDLFVFSLTM